MSNTTQQKLIENARELFYKYGIKRITMDELARYSGISKKTIYEYYSDKDALVFEVASEDFALHEKKMKQFTRESVNAIDEVVMAMKYVGDIFSNMNPNVILDMHKYHHRAWKSYLDFKGRCVHDNIVTNIKRGINEELYRNDLNIELMTRLRIAEIDFSLNPDYFPHGQFHFGTIQVELVKHFLFGIATLKGHKIINKLLYKTENK